MSHYQINYNQVAADYAQHRKIHPHVFQHLLEDGQVTSASTILEIGCGTGNYCTAIQQASGCHAYGIDPSEGMLTRAKAQSSLIDFRVGQAEKLDFPAQTFDLIYNVDVIHHVGDQGTFYQEAFRTLKPGGRICTVTDSEAVIRRRVPLSTYFPETVTLELGRYPRISVLQNLMMAAGFTELQESEVEFAYALANSQPYRDKAFSALHLIAETAWQTGLARLEQDLAAGPIAALTLYTLLWGNK